jgi:spore maturation protein CgeB
LVVCKGRNVREKIEFTWWRRWKRGEDMKLLVPDWKSFGREDIAAAITSLGHEIMYYQKEPANYRRDPKFRSELRSFIREQEIDGIFSSNYFPILSTVCKDLNIPYISWCYDNPLVLTYSETIRNSCNYIFLFDSKMVMDLQRLGVEQVYYLPMAVNPKRLHRLAASPKDISILKADVAFVGALYNEKHTLYDRMTNLDAYTRGYLEGLMAAQSKIYGTMFLESALSPEIIQNLQKAMPLETHKDGYETLEYLYANYFLCRKITQRERGEVFSLLDQRKDIVTKLYTPNPTPQYTHVKNMGTVHYEKEMPLVFRYSKINLNITLRSIQNGIPLRAMDIMGAGGFLLTNYQQDFSLHFVEGEDYVCYDSLSDMMDKIQYYLEHDRERQEIAGNGYKKVSQNHTYEQRFAEIFDILN